MGQVAFTYNFRSLEPLMKSDRKFAQELRWADYFEIKKMREEFLEAFFSEKYIVRNKQRIPLFDTLPYFITGRLD
jgi:hypothetical protein